MNTLTTPHTTPAAILPELLDLIRFQQEYIVAIPSDVAASLPAMPGFDGDWAVDLVERAKALAASAPVAPTSEGFVLAPHYRGYANLGTGQYVLNHTAPHEPAELIISIASEEDKAGRTIGDDRGNPAGKAIQPDEMAVRLAFTSVAGLDALEKQLRYLREVHFSEAAPVAPAPQPASRVTVDFAQIGTAGPFLVVNGRVSLPTETMLDLARMLEAAPKASPAPVVEDAEDAARYRWLREEAQYFPTGRAPAVVLCDEHDLFEKGKTPGEWGFITGKALDGAIDIARAPLQQGEYLPLPECDATTVGLGAVWNRHGVRAAIDADRAARGAAQAAPAEPDMRSVALAAGAYTTAYSMLTHAKVHNADVDGSTKRLVAAINGLRSALGPSAPVDKASTPDGTPCNVELRGLWYGAGGSFHGPTVESATMPEALLLPFLRSLLSAPVAEDAEIRKALHDAATSLETISRIAGKDPYMLEMVDVRIYAAARAKVARDAQAAQPEGGAYANS